MRYGRCLVVFMIGLWALAPDAAAQTADTGRSFRVFLKAGQVLPSYGEYAIVGDRLVFTLPIDDRREPLALQLMSLPVSSVDLDRTARYTEAVRAAHYAATRGEADYVAMSVEVQRALGQLAAMTDPKKRLAQAEEARRRLIAWSNGNYGYRAADIRELASLFDEVIAQLRAAAGESQFTLDLVAGPMVPAFEPLQPALSFRGSVEAALSAAAVADIGTERIAILRTIVGAFGGATDAEDLRLEAGRRLGEELAADRAYAELTSRLVSRADAAARRGDVRGVDASLREAAEQDRALGGRRPQELRVLFEQLNALLDRARPHQLALDHYALVRPQLVDYEKSVRPVFSGLDGIAPVLGAIRDMTGFSFSWLVRAEGHLSQLEKVLQQVTPPDDVQTVHATLVSALHMARQACARRHQAVVAPNMSSAREGSAAAAGAELLLAQARSTLLALLRPPKLQ